MSDDVTELLTDLERMASFDIADRESAIRRLRWVSQAAPDEIRAILQGILDRTPQWTKVQDGFLAAVFRHVLQRGAAEDAAPLEDAILLQAAALYRHLGVSSAARAYLPCLLTAARTPSALAAFADLMIADPPADLNLVAAIFGPLFQHRDYDPASLFPALLDGLKHISLAAAILDLSNFVTREGIVARHPASERVAEIALLLAGLVGRLGQIEGSPPAESQPVESASRQVKEGISLAVSLCDALALIGDKSAVGKLYQALELSHRRLRAEAAAALAKLGEQTGEQVLLQLAAEPVTRLRVLAYAEELGILDQVDGQYKTEQAKAEVECFLFRFVYAFKDAEFSNIGIAGPLTHAFAADLADLPPDDIYAAFAGWQAEHEDIDEWPVDALNDAQRVEVVRLERRLRDAGYDAIVPQSLGSFLGDKILVATAMYQGLPGVAVADPLQCIWWPRRGSSRPIDPDVAYCIYKGRKLLRAFNE
ncbi:MAG: HEAT repeat domain-containing protein [Pirellulaceae bacterium]|nr:HEAT repeat domain-containing protein [Pirellulaceae bacterium]